MHVNMHVNMHVYMHVKHACKNMHIYMHVNMHVYMHVYMHVKTAHLHACKNMHVYMHVNMHVTKHACYMHVFTCLSDFTDGSVFEKMETGWCSKKKGQDSDGHDKKSSVYFISKILIQKKIFNKKMYLL